MPFSHPRTIRFADTDAAGVVFFANYLSMCHEAYEEALIAAGIELQSFFSAEKVIVPIAKSEAEYLRPLHPGDKVRIDLAPLGLSADTFEIRYTLTRLGRPEKVAGTVRTEHVCLDTDSRRRIAFPLALAKWISSSA